MKRMTRWLDPPRIDASPLSPLNLPPLLAQTLIRRGIATPEAARLFLHPDLLPSMPFPDIGKAADLINAAIRQKEMICIWGDFDVDGQTATTVLVQTLRALGANVVYYIPIRGRESHGVHIESLKTILDAGAKSILTCDTGITAHEAIDFANSRGVDVIVTDHHDLGETLPNAKAIVNPKLLPEGHPLRNLAGVGVAYKLAEVLLDTWNLTSDTLLDLVALGLIADVALLQGETRALVQKGIRVLRGTNRLGLKIMAELAGVNLESLTEETIGFTFAPRLNALGRLSDANPAVELLLTNDPARARVLAAQIEGLNAQRKLLTSQVFEAAETQLREHPELLTEPVIALSHPDWPGGVVGIVANRLVDRYHKPALLLTESEDGILRGSARSIEGLHITEAIATQKELLLGYGGHPMAAGVSLLKDNLSAFLRGFGRAIERQFGKIIREEPALQIDAWLGLDEINLELADAIEMLAPFGAGNPSLTLATRSVTLKSVKEIGRTKDHRRIIVADEKGTEQDLLWWNGAEADVPDAEAKFDVAYSLRASSYRGQKQVTVQFEEFRIVDEKPVEVRERKVEIIDWRLQTGRIDSLDEDVLVWAEGADKAKGESRFELHPADEFAIYTTPSSPADLRAALEVVMPKKVYVFGVSPKPEKTDEFLARMAGMAKYVIHYKSGKVSIWDLASATAQRESAVRIGLEWLAAGGHVSIAGEEDALLLSASKEDPDQYAQRELYVAVRGILQESAAYREFFSRADAASLFKDRN